MSIVIQAQVPTDIIAVGLTIEIDSTGLALNSTLTQVDTDVKALGTTMTTTGVKIAAQTAGLALDQSVNAVGATLTSGAVKIQVNQDNVGLAKDLSVNAVGATVTSTMQTLQNEVLAVGATIVGIGTTLTSGVTQSLGQALGSTFTWVDGTKLSSPAAGTTLVSKTVSAGKSGFIYGWQITAGEANDFDVAWTTGGVVKRIRILFGSKGTTQELFNIPYNQGETADPSTTAMITLEGAGTTVYQARLLYGER